MHSLARSMVLLMYMGSVLLVFIFGSPASIQAANQAEGNHALNISVTPEPAQFIFVNGDADRFQAHHWMQEGYTGGVKNFSSEYKLKDGIKVETEGHALIDQNDYEALVSVKKGDLLYGLHLAKSGMREHKSVIVVEGNLDVVASHKAGVENIVASSGTALTASQLRTLARYTKTIIFALDEDAAGFAAAKRVLDLAIELQADPKNPDFTIRCLIIPDGVGKDPDEIVQKSPELWKKIAAHSEDVIEYVFTKRLRTFEDVAGGAKMTARKDLIDELLPYVARLTRPDTRHLYLLRIGDATHVDLESLQQMLKARTQLSPPKSVAQLAQGVTADRPSGNPRSPNPPPPSTKPDTKTDQAAAFLFGVALKYEGFTSEILSIISEDILTNDLWKVLYRGLRVVYTSGQQLQTPAPQESLFSRLRAWLTSQGHLRETSAVNALALTTDELLAGLTPTEVRQEADNNILLISQEKRRSTRTLLERDIREAELSGDDERLQTLMRAYRDEVSRK